MLTTTLGPDVDALVWAAAAAPQAAGGPAAIADSESSCWYCGRAEDLHVLLFDCAAVAARGVGGTVWAWAPGALAVMTWPG